MTTIKIDFNKLIELLAINCWSIKKLCEIAGIKYGTVRNIRLGKGVKPETAGKICKALNVPLDDIKDKS